METKVAILSCSLTVASVSRVIESEGEVEAGKDVAGSRPLDPRLHAEVASLQPLGDVDLLDVADRKEWHGVLAASEGTGAGDPVILVGLRALRTGKRPVVAEVLVVTGADAVPTPVVLARNFHPKEADLLLHPHLEG